jgi:hypothetical protein
MRGGEDFEKTILGSGSEDFVNNPPHYNEGSIECIEAMKAMADGVSNVTAHEAYCWQNAFKYLWRWPYKNGVEDLKKCRWYLDRLIKQLENDQ